MQSIVLYMLLVEGKFTDIFSVLILKAVLDIAMVDTIEVHATFMKITTWLFWRTV